MAVTASGLFFLTLEKQLVGAAATDPESWELEDNLGTLVSDAAVPAFDTMDFWDDLSGSEVTGSGWTDTALTSTEITVAAGILTFDAADVSVASTTLTSAMAYVLRMAIGTDGTDCLIGLWDFITAVSTVNGTFGVQWHATGLITADLVP
jgi:hypothetical protein